MQIGVSGTQSCGRCNTTSMWYFTSSYGVAWVWERFWTAAPWVRSHGLSTKPSSIIFNDEYSPQSCGIGEIDAEVWAMRIDFVYWEISVTTLFSEQKAKRGWRWMGIVTCAMTLRKLNTMGTDLVAVNPYHVRVRVAYGTLLCNHDYRATRVGLRSQGSIQLKFLTILSPYTRFRYPRFRISDVLFQ
jgi:hypothetical protein